MEAARHLWDYKEERINGKVYLMSPSGSFFHGAVNGNIYSILKRHLKNSLCYASVENLDLLIDDDYLQPDIMLICDRRSIKKNGYRGVPRFVVETLSPSTAKRDRTEKKDIYERIGVDEYWIVSPIERSIEIYYLEDGRYILQEVATLLDADDKDYNGDTVIALRSNPEITFVLAEIFEGLDDIGE